MDYESDHIDEELEHRLYSMVDAHYANDEPRMVVEPSPSVSTSKTKSIVDQKVTKKQPPSIIYLSDSDEDPAADDEPVIIKEAKRDLWHIDYKDFLISNPVHGKFYRPKIWCSRCRKEGNHPVKLCHLPKYKICYICGGIGHLGQYCQNQHCRRCRDFHTTSRCTLPQNVREFKCRICSKYGHLDDVCPNHWRKFHNITDPKIDPDSTVTQIRKNTNKSCSICGHHQHYSFECDKLRNRAIEISSPYDINTTFGGRFVPTRNQQPKTPQQYYQQQFQMQLNTPSSSHSSHPSPSPSSSYRKFGRRSAGTRYFTNEPDYLQGNRPDANGLPSNFVPFVSQSLPPPPPPPSNSKKSSRRKAKKRKKKNNSIDNQSKVAAQIDYIKGSSIRSGKVEKSKNKRRKDKKQHKNHLIKLDNELFRQSKQSNLKRFV